MWYQCQVPAGVNVTKVCSFLHPSSTLSILTGLVQSSWRKSLVGLLSRSASISGNRTCNRGERVRGGYHTNINPFSTKFPVFASPSWFSVIGMKLSVNCYMKALKSIFLPWYRYKVDKAAFGASKSQLLLAYVHASNFSGLFQCHSRLKVLMTSIRSYERCEKRLAWTCSWVCRSHWGNCVLAFEDSM